MKIIHFSDSHAGGPAEDISAYFDKRWVGVFNYQFRRQYQHDQSLLSKAVSFIVDEKPDLAVCTGDITSTGQPGEYRQALGILGSLVRDTEIPFIYVPGNHDYYVYNRKCNEAMREAVSVLNRGDFRLEELPVKRRYSELEFLIVNESWPANLLSSGGYLRKEDSDRICRWTGEKKELPRVLVGHYPLIEAHPWLRIRHRLRGQKDVLSKLREGAIDLSLCGHKHLPYAEIDRKGRGEICAGSITRNACMAVIEYDPAKDIFEYSRHTF